MKNEYVLDNGLKIKGASLLSTNDFQALPVEIRKYSKWWWLKSAGLDGKGVAYVGLLGMTDLYGHSPYLKSGCVRPTLAIDCLEDSGLNIGDRFVFKNIAFIILRKDLAFCLSDIGSFHFDSSTNQYEKADIKNFINSWFNYDL